MLSYRHAFHAGNFADVFKHVVLLAVLDYLKRKCRPVSYIETHAGAGQYDLQAEFARKREEFRGGVGQILAAEGAPPAVARYLDCVRRFNADGELLSYPGSPVLARMALAPDDPMNLFELHPADARALQANMAGRRHMLVRQEDGFKGCVGLLPPPSRRGLLLMDPAYEVKTDYDQVVTVLQHAYRRFATGVYALWYPVVERPRIDRLRAELVATGISAMECWEFGIAPDSSGFGMTASGMVVVNPPFTLRQTLAESLPWLAARLAPNGQGWWRHRVLRTEHGRT